jgi:hypothetical protein
MDKWGEVTRVKWAKKKEQISPKDNICRGPTGSKAGIDDFKN